MAKKNYRSNDPCVACKKEGEGMVCFHHLYTRKTYPEFEGFKWNQIPTCSKCHKIYHNKGTSFMAENHIDVFNWLIKNEWYYCSFGKKWRHNVFGYDTDREDNVDTGEALNYERAS